MRLLRKAILTKSDFCQSLLIMSATRKKIIDILENKSAHKQQVFNNTITSFNLIKEVGRQLVTAVADELKEKEALNLKYEDLNAYECGIYFAGDMLLLNMHTNVFTFERGNQIWRNRYIKDDNKRAYFGVVHVYNFLADSFKYNRQTDSGVLLCRLFINAEGHFFAEGHRNLVRPVSNIEHQVINEESISFLLEECMKYALNFDLTAPPFGEVMTASVSDLRSNRSELQMRTTKKLGYRR